ncbi:M56 family metallopeptidase [Chryseosolibacter indicus]|uniref:M48 family metalloprotease n=1 Tax=Chryseosolibacter indicus TaxID=2782351 RepID=A0ABS5VWA2_9BACT|nr:M56 family metallopeptidase [Chryseosolibacter indicus]MBT1705110.1 M48 family metalloprotease [Chryseosolibacter indicus]
MNIANHFFSSNLVGAFGWTLIHSLWQSLIIVGLTASLLKLFTYSSTRRYIIASVSLVFILVAGLATFLILTSERHSTPAAPDQAKFSSISSATIQVGSTASDSFSLLSFIESNMHVVVIAWLVGTLLLSLRLLAGWFYLRRITSSAIALNNAWSDRLKALAIKLNIKRVVQLAESNIIHSPMVIGFIKPVILIPVGMLSGMTIEQVEAIFIHELAHIKRYDYLVNVLQSIIEIVLFFNPFVWILSSIIRREREYCCDDTVVLNQVNKLAYARALATLQEAEIHKTTFAVSLAENKNELLTRIKRIMEKPFQQPTKSSRIIPAILLVVGLICASWISIQTGKTINKEEDSLAQDTTIKGKSKAARYSKRTITTIDENGDPKQEVVENFEGDESQREMFAPQPLDPIPPVPSIDFVIPPIPAIPDFHAMLPSMFFDGDTIPAPGRPYTRNLDDISLQIEESIREHFKDFELQQEKLQSLTQDINAIIEKEISTELQHGLAMANHAEIIDEALHSQLQDQLMTLQDGHLKDLDIDMKHLNDNLRELEDNMHAFQDEIQKELVQDGYLKKDEKINKMEWSNGEIRINDITIKEKDKKKYNELHEKFFENSNGYHFRHVE